MSKRTFRLAARLGMALALALASASRADFLQSFRAGIRAVDYHEWRAVEIAMRQAIAKQPRSTGDNVRIYGVRVVPYIPHYFLGLALYRQGDCAAAATALAEAEAQGTVHGLYRARLDFFQDVCAQRLGRPRPMPTLSSPPQRTASLATADPTPVPPPAAVHQSALEEMVRDARQWIAKCEKLAKTLDERRRADPRKFDRDPTRAEVLEVARYRMSAAAFRLEGCRREGDLAGAERSRDDAQATWEMLDELAKSL